MNSNSECGFWTGWTQKWNIKEKVLSSYSQDSLMTLLIPRVKIFCTNKLKRCHYFNYLLLITIYYFPIVISVQYNSVVVSGKHAFILGLVSLAVSRKNVPLHKAYLSSSLVENRRARKCYCPTNLWKNPGWCRKRRTWRSYTLFKKKLTFLLRSGQYSLFGTELPAVVTTAWENGLL